MAYKPFGEKLNLDKDGKESTTAPYTNRGYTGHEHIEETNLIHMNGRVCDPTIGRFTSADPYIQAPYNTQSFNRYSYVMNNPLKYVDPSGYLTVELPPILFVADPIEDIPITFFIEHNDNPDWGGLFFGSMDKFLAQSLFEMDYRIQAYITAQAQATAQATAAQQTQLNQNLNYQSMNSNSSHLAAGGFIRFQPTNQVPDLDHHDILTAFSVIPVVGGIAGTIDALSYAYEGDYSTAATMLAVGFIPGGKLGMKVVGGFKSGRVGTEVVQRWMSKAELQATRETGLIRGGRSGEHYVTDFANKNAQRARQRLALDYTPEIRVSLEVPKGVFSSPTKVKPLSDMSGGGMERTATGEIPVNILKVYE